MAIVALLNMGTGLLEERQNIGTGPQPATPFGNKRWLPDNPPPFNVNTQQLQVDTPIPANAPQVPYSIVPRVFDYSSLNYLALIRRRADALKAEGKVVEALLLLKTIGE